MREEVVDSFPEDAEGYRACSVCNESVVTPKDQSWIQLNDVTYSGPGLEGIMAHTWTRETEGGPISELAGPVLHVQCMHYYVDAMIAEAVASQGQ